MVLMNFASRVQNLIGQAATERSTVSFPALFSCFPEKTPVADVYDTLEYACANLASWDVAIYSAVLAKRADGLPGDGFFDMFRIHRADEYQEISQGTSSLRLTQEQKKRMVDSELARVYENAQSNR